MYRLLNWVAFVPIFASFALPTALHARSKLTNEKPDVVNQKRFSDLYGKLPLSFEVNKGQVDSRVKYLAHASGYSVLLSANEVLLRASSNGRAGHNYKPTSTVNNASASPKEIATRNAFEILNPKARPLLRIKPVGANPRPRLVALEELPGKSNYFIGNDPKKWRPGIPTYLRVKYEEIYPGIDLIFHGDQGQLEYDFIVAPGANPSVIQLSFSGADKLSFDDHGNLIVRAVIGDEVMQFAPVLYQEVNGARENVKGRYVLRSRHRVGFQVGDYDNSKPLIIDPVLSYSTYFGTEWGDAGSGIAVDADGNAYVIVNIGNSAAEVLKLNASGSAIIYAIWLGGTAGGSSGQGIAVDASGNAYVSGRTESNDFPTVNPFQPFRGGVDVFITKISAVGDALLYSSYLGGSGTEQRASIAIDRDGNAYVAGETFSWDFPTIHALQNAFKGPSSDGFVTKINTKGDALVYSTYLGGSSNDAITRIAVDSTGNVYVAGQTFSADFPTARGLQPNYGGGGDAFVTKIDAAGSSLVYSTYLGGAQEDRATGLALDPEGNVYVVGVTESRDFPTVNSLQPFTPQTAGFTATNGFVTKINVIGDALVYSSYFLGAGFLPVSAIAVDAFANAYITGTAGGPGEFRAVNSLQEFGGGECFASTAFISEPIRRPCFDAFVAKINAAGNAVLYSSYLGGSSDDVGLDISLDNSRNVYVTGVTSSNNFPTIGAIQVTLKRPFWSDAFIAKIAEPLNPPCTLECAATASTSGKVGEPVGFSATATSSNCTDIVTYEWNFGDATSTAAGQTARHAYISGGTYTWKVTASVSGAVVCSKIGTIRVTANPRRRP